MTTPLAQAKAEYAERTDFWPAGLVMALETAAPRLGFVWVIECVEALVDLLQPENRDQLQQWIDQLEAFGGETEEAAEETVRQIWPPTHDPFRIALANLFAAAWKLSHDISGGAYRTLLINALRELGAMPGCRALGGAPIFDLFEQLEGRRR
ncbi:hypothetical protein [Blastopirellula marina]|uniref:Uncharacterized protein n=1 Tax=Blastopirellula marina TaxID=124 RepID=A0A2S8FTC3_9BACT|nr:hypothetical protein [Blastopirellula marina]PQO35425.1 hypothetical protein C5Y98_13765 [Blastopirellula marina]PTL44065.1 hypothetical protein C5Y97_13775 [Blastopirellula marina]